MTVQEFRAALTAKGLDLKNYSDDQLRQMLKDPAYVQKILREIAPPGQGGESSLLGARPDDEQRNVPAVPLQGTTVPKKDTGTKGPGTWETAMTSVAAVIPSILQSAQFRHPYAPAANIGGRRPLDIPSAATVYGKKEKDFQSLLAMFLRGR